MTTAFCTSPRFAEHLTGPHHPERPSRLRAIFAAVREAGLVRSPNPLPHDDMHFDLQLNNPPRLLEIEPYPATVKQIAMVHAPRHVQRVRRACSNGSLLDAGDTAVCPASFEIALLAAGAGLRCVDAVMNGEARRAFAAVRPPGHHAEPNASMGFCLFDNIAIAARYAQQRYGLERIAIVDFDVHHGNGTQAAFQDDASILFASLHEDPHILFPNSGFDWEIGSGTGKGFTMNLPMPLQAGDGHYMHALQSKVIPRLHEFAPELILVSAGFDGHVDDPLADMALTESGYYQMTRALAQVADVHCGGKLISMLEGGYHLRALGRSVVQHLLALVGNTDTDQTKGMGYE